MTTEGGTQKPLVEGYCDGVSGFDIAGWAWFPAAPDDVVVISARIAGRTVAQARADRFRADLRDAGKRGGRCAFRIPLSALRLAGQGATIDVIAGDSPLGSPVTVSADTVRGAEIYAQRLGPDADPAFDPADQSSDPPTVFPLRFDGPAGVEGWIEYLDETIVHGWATPKPGASGPVELAVMCGEQEIGRICASSWRLDLAENRQGDGRAGIHTPPPPRLLDGHRRYVDLREVASGLSVLSTPMSLEIPPLDVAPKPPAPRAAARPGWRMRLGPRKPALSIVVIFYNMRREAERTLTSLTRAYQKDCDDLDYEVICVDNGSNPPLDEKWIESFGPEFRLFRPSKLLPSPCFALNEAARTARGQNLAMMIDGAHIVTPGVFREVLAALAETPESVVGLRQWFIGGDQRWLSSSGYSRAKEDIAFARIAWPSDGYRLFEISRPMMPSPNNWFDSAAESNFLVLPASVFERIGGYDEKFDTPGGSLSNLDLFTRATDAVGGTATMLVGEASFHQYHGGTTTNIDDDTKDSEVRRYVNEFFAMRKDWLRNVDAKNLRYRGHMPTALGSTARQLPLFPAFTGVTDRIRHADKFLYHDHGAAAYLHAYTVESGTVRDTTWGGKPVGVAAGDLVSIQEMIRILQPDRIVAVNQLEGMLGFLSGVIDAAVTGILHVSGDAASPATLDRVARWIGDADTTMVIFHPDDGDDLPVDSLKAYMKFVSLRSYLVFTGTATGQPWLGYSTRWYRRAIQLILSGKSGFDIDPSWEAHLVTACPSGYLRRTGPRLDELGYDESLDSLEAL